MIVVYCRSIRLSVASQLDSLTRHVAQATRPQRGRLFCMRLERQPIVSNVNYGGLSLLGPDWSITRSHHFGKTQVGLGSGPFYMDPFTKPLLHWPGPFYMELDPFAFLNLLVLFL